MIALDIEAASVTQPAGCPSKSCTLYDAVAPIQHAHTSAIARNTPRNHGRAAQVAESVAVRESERDVLIG